MRAPLKRYYLKSILPGLLYIGMTVGAYLLEPSAPSQAVKTVLAVLPAAGLTVARQVGRDHDGVVA